MLRQFPEHPLRRALLPVTYVEAAIAGARERRRFERVETYCMFIGYPRSGHSLVGSLLDAHPDVIIAHELDALGFIGARFTRDQLYALILANSRSIAARGRRHLYDYVVPGQSQGSSDTLRVIGDKRGGASMVRLRRDPTLLDRLNRVVGDPVRFVHVVRNPFDNVSTIAKRWDATIEDSVRIYADLCGTVADLKARVPPERVFDLRHEDLVRDARESLRTMCEFLRIVPSESYLDACAGIVWPSTHRSRDERDWDPGTRVEVERIIAAHEFLRGYTFED
ncbi:MAG TPA: sulfotransferase [Actinomycetota bacterium]|jgi:hypothetical protein